MNHCRSARDQAAGGRGQHVQHAAGTGHGDDFAVRVNRHLRLDVGVDPPGLRLIARGSDGGNLCQTDVGVRVNQAGVDVLAGDVDLLRPLGQLHLFAQRDDLALLEQQHAAFDGGPIDWMNRAADERDRVVLRCAGDEGEASAACAAAKIAAVSAKVSKRRMLVIILLLTAKKSVSLRQSRARFNHILISED